MWTEIVEGMSAEKYYADPCEVPSFTQSTAQTILTRTPYHAFREHPRLGGKRRETTDAMDHGSLFDAMMMGDEDGIEIVDAKDWRTKAAQAARDAARDAGKTPVLAHKVDAAREASETALGRLLALAVDLRKAKKQVCVFWGEDGVQCRGRLDAWFDLENIVLDVKTTEDASPSAVEKSIATYGYHIQAAAYQRAIEANTGKRPSYLLAFIETKPVIDVAGYTLDGVFLEIGEEQWLQAVDSWRGCRESGSWPGHWQRGIRTAFAPKWLEGREI